MSLLLVEAPHGHYADVFQRIRSARAEALFIAPGAAAYIDRALIVDFSNQSRLPSSFDFREAVELGGWMSYGANLVDNYRRAAGFVGKILTGAKPAELPIEQPTRFELVVNAKTAKALGLAIPQRVLPQADEVIG